MVVHGWEQTAHKRKVPSEELWRYRAAEAAGSESANLSGLLSRLHNACRWSFPEEEARRSICRLLLIYRSLDHEPKPLVSCVRRIARRHKRFGAPRNSNKSFQPCKRHPVTNCRPSARKPPNPVCHCRTRHSQSRPFQAFRGILTGSCDRGVGVQSWGRPWRGCTTGWGSRAGGQPVVVGLSHHMPRSLAQV